MFDELRKDKSSGKDWDKDKGGSRALFDEKYFRRVHKFNGGLTKCQRWYFDFIVAIGKADVYLAEEDLKWMRGAMLSANDKGERVDFKR